MSHCDRYSAGRGRAKTGAGQVAAAAGAAALILALSAPSPAQDPPSPAPAGSAPSPGPAPAAPPPPGDAAPPASGPGAAGSGASDEDLEAAVLGGKIAPPRPVSPPRASPPRPPVAATPPQPPLPPPRPPAAAPRERRWREPARDTSADEDDGRPALAIELATSGLASGALRGGLFLGARLPVGLIIGGFLDYTSSSTTMTNNFNNNTNESAFSFFRLGAGLRQPLLRTEDGRVELFGGGEVGLVRRTREVSMSGGSATNVSAWGPTLAVGPGLRLWVHEHLAIGYAAELQVSHLSGDAAAFPGPVTPDLTVGIRAAETDITLVGGFQLLGVF